MAEGENELNALVERAVATATAIAAAKFERVTAWLNGLAGDGATLEAAAGREGELAELLASPEEEEQAADALILGVLIGRAVIAEKMGA